MQKKNIFKALAAAMLMPAMLLTTACSNDDDAIINNEPTVKKGYALPVTVSATRQGDATTRATFDGSKLNFSAGDQLFVSGSHTSAGQFAGTLTWQSGGTFSGTIYTKENYTGNASSLFSQDVNATLLPAGYESTGYISISVGSSDLYDDTAIANGSHAFVASETAKATGVEQLSFERASTYYSSGFALAPLCAVLNFTISGLEAGAKNVTLYVTYNNNDFTVTGIVTPNASGVATFAVGVLGGINITDKDYNLTVGTHNFTLPSTTTFAAGNIYNITRSAAPAPSYTMAAAATTSDKGKLICTAGHIHVYGEDAACTAGRVAKIIYVGSTGHATYNNGLALALEDMSTNPNTEFSWDNSGANNGGKTAAELCSAWNASKPVTDADWLLASKDQWNYMLGTDGAGTYDALRDGFTSVGGSNLVEKDYWSSTEINATEAWMFNFGWDWWYESSKDRVYPMVRACLAF